jgi:hypothetical protein
MTCIKWVCCHTLWLACYVCVLFSTTNLSFSHTHESYLWRPPCFKLHRSLGSGISRARGRGRGVAVNRTNHQPWSPTPSDPRRRRHRAATTQHRKPGATGGERDSPALLGWVRNPSGPFVSAPAGNPNARRERNGRRHASPRLPLVACHLAPARLAAPSASYPRSATGRRWLPTFQSPPATCQAAPRPAYPAIKSHVLPSPNPRRRRRRCILPVRAPSSPPPVVSMDMGGISKPPASTSSSSSDSRPSRVTRKRRSARCRPRGGGAAARRPSAPRPVSASEFTDSLLCGVDASVRVAVMGRCCAEARWAGWRPRGRKPVPIDVAHRFKILLATRLRMLTSFGGFALWSVQLLIWFCQISAACSFFGVEFVIRTIAVLVSQYSYIGVRIPLAIIQATCLPLWGCLQLTTRTVCRSRN